MSTREAHKKYKARPEIRLRNAKLKKEWDFRKRYGITSLDAISMLLDQGNKCSICHDPLSIPNVDHCHRRNKVRGILCSHCNKMLGFARDNQSTLRRAAAYLAWHEAQ